MKISFILGLQLVMIVSIGSFVGWPYMKELMIFTGLVFFVGLVLFIAVMSKD